MSESEYQTLLNVVAERDDLRERLAEAVKWLDLNHDDLRCGDGCECCAFLAKEKEKG